ncbi:MAG: GTP-binding protein, partial [Bacilli bacterium]|nr:GTP-binding protein [Bacilli bacterium]
DDDCCCHEEHHHHHDEEECCCHEHHNDCCDDDDDCCCHEEHHHHHDEEECDDPECECHHHHHHHHGHDADEVFVSWGIETPRSFTREELDSFLKILSDENSGLGIILRSKGILKASDNEKWYYFDFVAGDYEIRLGEPDYTGRIVVIGSKLDEGKIADLFNKKAAK